MPRSIVPVASGFPQSPPTARCISDQTVRVEKAGRTSIVRVTSMASTLKRRIWATPSIHNLMNFEPLISSDESFMIFMAGGRPDGHGGFDLYISYNREGVWTKPANLGDKINSSGNEYSPTISPDGKYFFWTSTRGFADKPLDSRLSFQELTKRLISPRNGLGDIYQIDIGVLSIGKLSD